MPRKHSRLKTLHEEIDKFIKISKTISEKDFELHKFGKTLEQNDKEKLAQEQMRIYQEMGVSPFGSCLPTLIQFPIIIALYQSIAFSFLF